MMKIVGYIRVSSSKQKDNYSLSQQKKRIEDYCKFRFGDESYNLSIIEDKAKTARNLNRSGIKQILDCSNDIDIVIIFRLDRLCRNLQDLIYIVSEFKKNNTEVVFLKESIDTSTSVGKLLMHVLGAFAEFESDTIGERALMGMIGKCCNGEYPFLRPPFGYVINEDNKLIKDSNVVDKLELAIKLLKQQNLNVKETARILSKKYTEKQRTWEHRLENVISKKLYYGIFEFNDEEYFDVVLEKYINHELSKTQQNIYDYIIEDIVCDSCGTKLTNASAINRFKNVYLYKYCKRCKKRVRDDYINDIITIEKKYISKKVIRKLDHFRYNFDSKNLEAVYKSN